MNPGVIRGGTRSNVVAAEAEAEIDVRVTSAKTCSISPSCLPAFAPKNRRCTLTVTGGMNRPPMERERWHRELFAKAQRPLPRNSAFR